MSIDRDPYHSVGQQSAVRCQSCPLRRVSPRPDSLPLVAVAMTFRLQEEIQKRLSLPADLRLPVSVVEKLNRTPTLDQPLTRKNRRASLVRLLDKLPFERK